MKKLERIEYGIISVLSFIATILFVIYTGYIAIDNIDWLDWDTIMSILACMAIDIVWLRVFTWSRECLGELLDEKEEEVREI